MPNRNEREELYEDHEYGLGVVMRCDDPLTTVVEGPYYYPLVLDLGTTVVNTVTSMTIQFDYNYLDGDATCNPGSVRLYKLDDGVYQELLSGQDYTPGQLGFDGSLGTVILYVMPGQKHDVYSEWFNPFNNTKPDSAITATLLMDQMAISSDRIKYINTSQGSFWNNYLYDPSIRHAFASQGVYGSSADTPAAHATPTSFDLPQFALQLISGRDDLMAMGFDAATAALIGSNNVNGLNVCVYYDHITGNAILAFQGSDPVLLAREIFVSSGLFTQQDVNGWTDNQLIQSLRDTDTLNDALALLASGAIYGSSAPDWVCNTAQSMGRATPQYDDAMTIGCNLPKNFVNVNDAISFDKYTGWTITGHSLGGGLASAAAGVAGNLAGSESFGHRVDTFNASGLHANTVGSFLTRKGLSVPTFTHDIVAYRTESDELTYLQEEYWIANLYVPDATGIPYWLEDFVDARTTTPDNADWPGHEMKSIFQGMFVDAIGRQLGVLYVIDFDGDVCYRGQHKQSSTETIRIATTPYAF